MRHLATKKPCVAPKDNLLHIKNELNQLASYLHRYIKNPSIQHEKTILNKKKELDNYYNCLNNEEADTLNDLYLAEIDPLVEIYEDVRGAFMQNNHQREDNVRYVDSDDSNSDDNINLTRVTPKDESDDSDDNE